MTALLILDTGIELLRAILGRIDLRKLLLDPRVSILIDPPPETLREFLLTHYIPSISGDIKTVPLRSRVNLVKDFFQSCFDTFQEGMETLSHDFTVQTQFGKKWFINSLANLPIAEIATHTLSPKKKVLITAAGPSLEASIEHIRNERREGLLIATDTSLPVLLENDLIPEVVISIDCQHISYHHFLSGLPREVTLVLDLASPPLLARLSQKIIFFASAHPFCRYVSTYWRKFPSIDTSGGNVTHAAVSLAITLGADQIYLYGADFSFPRGKSYARGTYLYPYFLSHSNRYLPLETSFSHFLFSNQKLERRRGNKGIRYIPLRMEHYRLHLETLIEKSNILVLPFVVEGEPIRGFPHPPKHERSLTKSIFSAGPISCSWKEFLQAYKQDIQNLPFPFDPVISYLDSLSLNQRNLWTTLLPISAVIRKEHGKEDISPSTLLLESRTWALEKIERYLIDW
ncbi:MAG: DUF115 domain-containing protein [Spirochaetes bacterium]|nr:DUF115 domain-containing protein [Spirochaetota bacterium]